MQALKEVDLQLDAGWIVPIEPDALLIDHSLLIDGGRIVAIAPTVDLPRDYSPRERLSFPGHVLLPGLVNAHVHGAMSLLRGIADDVGLQAWLHQDIWPREARFVSPEFVYEGAQLAAYEMLRGGITCCNDMYFFPDATARAYVKSGLRAMIGLPILDFPTPYAANADSYLQAGLAARDAWKHEPGLRFSFAPHAPYTVHDRTWERVVTYARELDLPIQTHLLESANERDDSRAQYGTGPLERLHALGATGPSFIAVHAVHLQTSDIELLAAQGSHVVHCPASNLKLANGFAPVAALLEAGVNVALGTDGAASNNRLDILAEARLASLTAKALAQDAAALPAASALRMATLGGAKALCLDSELGSLLPGKMADVIAVDLSAPDQLPCYDPRSHLVHVVSREQVSDVWIGGQHIVRDRRVTTLDRAELASRARFWQDRLQ
jgi:5-methylthioadenosine/S-adenosylhomocysteine deaminase